MIDELKSSFLGKTGKGTSFSRATKAGLRMRLLAAGASFSYVATVAQGLKPNLFSYSCCTAEAVAFPIHSHDNAEAANFPTSLLQSYMRE